MAAPGAAEDLFPDTVVAPAAAEDTEDARLNTKEHHTQSNRRRMSGKRPPSREFYEEDIPMAQQGILWSTDHGQARMDADAGIIKHLQKLEEEKDVVVWD